MIETWLKNRHAAFIVTAKIRFADTLYSNLQPWGTHMTTLDAFIAQENIALCKKLLADRNITDGQRDVISKILAEEEAKLLDFFGLSATTGNVIPIAPFLLAKRQSSDRAI